MFLASYGLCDSCNSKFVKLIAECLHLRKSMTFVLNLLHKDFSLIAADKQGNANGPVAFSIGEMNIQINSPKTTIEGIQKVFLSDNRAMALGIAGTLGEHEYINLFSRAESPVQGMKCIRDHMEAKFRFDQRDLLLNGQDVMQNQSILSFFDAEKGAFFTTFNAYTPFSNLTCTYARRQSPTPMLVHAGSGSSMLESAVGLESINQFIADVEKGANLALQLEWFEKTFKAVSKVASGCGEDFNAVLASRENPHFVFVRGR